MLSHLIEKWLSDPSITENIVSRKHFPAEAGKMFDFPQWLNPTLARALYGVGINRLYEHQLEAVQALRAGSHILTVSGVASGKSLIYQIPILDSLLTNEQSSALLIFPTKALSQDQGEKFNELVSQIQSPFFSQPFLIAQFDGDTPANKRPKISQTAQVLLTNPDMLHQSILPQHSRWSRFLSSLRYIVLDEIHIYRGVFGSHVANILRRLKRIINHYGATPQFILTTGTIYAPEQFAEALVEEALVKIEPKENFSAEKEIWIYNPPILNSELNVRRHPFEDATRLTLESLENGVRSILFCRSRKAVELLLSQLREKFDASILDIELLIRSYRSGYLPSLRREIEQSLRNGKIQCVITTNALELGIDIGGLDVTILLGFPGSIASTWQQFGRSGRRGKPSLGILILSNDPLDQYLAHHPSYLWGSSPEQVIIDPNNPLILLSHLRCALYELPIQLDHPTFGKAPAELVAALLNSLTLEGSAIKGRKDYYYNGIGKPSSFTIRSISDQTIQLFLKENDQHLLLGTVDSDSADWMVHPGAIYFHEGHPYYVESLDFEHHFAILKTGSLEQTTQPLIQTQVVFLYPKELQNRISQNGFRYQIAYGSVELSRKVEGYSVLDRKTHQILEKKPLNLPPRTLSTMAFWLTLSHELVECLRQQGAWTNDPNQYGSNWENQKHRARQRDHHRCQLCGVPEQGTAHHVHHKVPFRQFPDPVEANRLENLVTLCPACHRKVEETVRVQSGLAALGYAFLHISPLFALCDRQDLGVSVDPKFTWCQNQPTILIHEQIPGGVGLAYRLYEIAPHLFSTIKSHIQACPCLEGCPACTGPIAANGSGGKREALALLESLVV